MLNNYISIFLLGGFYENKKIDIFMYINDISNILEKNIFLMNFMSANDVIKLINEKYNSND